MAVNEVASITLRADSRDLKRAADDAKKLGNASDKMAREVSTASQKTEIGFKKINAGAIALGAGIAALGVGLFRGFIANTIAQEKASAQLEAALKSTGGAAGLSAEALKSYAGELQNATTFGDEAIISAQAMLLTFTKIGTETFPRATRAVLDVAQAMGTDLKSAAIQVGKALNDPLAGITALSRSGITFSESQKDVIKALVETGQTAQAQRVILKELETQFGGSAMEARNTLGGALASLKNAFGDLLEGDSGPSGLRDAIEDLTAVFQSSETKQSFATVIGLLADVATFAVKIAAGIGQTIAGFRNLAKETAGASGSEGAGGNQKLIDQLTNERNSKVRARGGNETGDDIKRLDAEIARLTEIKVLREFEFREKGRIAALQRNTDADAAKKSRKLPPNGAPGVAVQDLGAERFARAIEISKQQAQQFRDAQADIGNVLSDVAAQMGGESVAAGQRLAETLLTVQQAEERLIAIGALDASTQAQIAEARRGAQQVFQQDIDTINARTTPAEDLLQSLRDELELSGLSNDERERTVLLRRAEIDLTTEAGRAAAGEVTSLLDRIREQDDQARIFDNLRESSADAFASIIDGSRSAKGALSDFADSVLRMVAQNLGKQLAESLFGGPGGGSPSGSGSGSIFGSLIGSLFGSGRAFGGALQPGRLHPINERGEPEIVSVGGQDFVTSPRGGSVRNTRAGSGNNTSITINVQPSTDNRAADQIARAVSRTQQRALARAS